MRKIFLNLGQRRGIIFIVFLLIFLSLIGVTSSAQISAEDYAPIYYFETGEKFYPIDAKFQIDWSYLYEIGNSVPISTDPSESELSSYSSSLYQYYYLDNQEGSVDNYDKIIEDSQDWENTWGNKVYYRVYSLGSTQVIQYWMFYAFNAGELNQHEGDWEMVQILLINDEPSEVSYSQHYSGQRATWTQVEKEGNHIKVYVARGSHANYLKSYSGKLGIASDIVGANGKILKPSDYTLDTLEDKPWIDYHGRWGEIATTEANAIEASILGQAGPEGPKYRENGAMWDNPVSWGNSLIPANDIIFIFEWILYNFILLFIIITLVIIAIMAFLIYRRYKKYGLGPRIVSMLYINGFNLHSIGNILCIVGIVIAIFGLFAPWYEVSYGVSGEGITETFQTKGMVNLLKLDGINGLLITIPGTSGPIPLGSFILPFSLFIGIGLVFLIIATIGIPLSKKLGTKYIWRGIRIIIPFVLILVVIMIIGSIISSIKLETGTNTDYIKSIVGPISSYPFGGKTTTYITESGISGKIDVQWQLGLGTWLLLIAGIIIIIAGVLEIISKTQFFVTKTPLPGQALPRMPAQQPPVSLVPPQIPPQQPSLQKQESQDDKSKVKFCTECGEKLNENAIYCNECGKKLR
jgi:hypothetical protein